MIKVNKSIHISQPDILEEAWVRSVNYVSSTAPVLLESVSIGGQLEFYFYHHGIENKGQPLPYGIIRRSMDNGKTWEKIEDWVHFKPLNEQRRLQTWEPSFIPHPKTGALARIYFSNEDIPGTKSWDKGSPVDHTGRLWYQFSTDCGNSWSPPKQLIISGDEYDENHWGPEIWIGKGTGRLEAVWPVYVSENTFLLAFQSSLYRQGQALVNKFQTACLIGTWRNNQTIDWEFSRYVFIDPPHSIYGADESSLAVLPDGRIIMTIRVQVDCQPGNPPGRRYFATSSDLGKTWSTPDYFRYEDGGDVYNCGCLGHILRSGKNGRYYLITHILDQPSSNGQLPRNFLQIAEVNTKTLRVVRDSVTVIEGKVQPREKWDSCWYSNWVWYEDRETKNLVLFMTGNPGDQGRFEGCGVPPHSFKYEIELPH
jgi:hypothetical protein